MVSYKDIENLLGVPMQEIVELLGTHPSGLKIIPARVLWRLIVAGAELDREAVSRLEARYQEIKGKRHRTQVSYSQRERIIERDKNRCRYCGVRVNKYTRVIDHVIPWSRGGRNTDDNLVVACVKCNTRKGANLLEEVGMTLLPVPQEPWEQTGNEK